MKIKKTIVAFAISVLLLTTLIFQANASIASLDDFSYDISSGSIIITKYNGKSTNVVIQNSYIINNTNYYVTEIGEYAFENSTIESITLPEGISKISEGAFYNCDSLTKITIPETVTQIDLYAFDDCNILTDVTILNSDVSIGESAFGYYYSGRKYYIVDNFIIRGPENSTAQEYATTNEMNFHIYTKPILGDINCDKIFNVKDLVRLKKIISGSISSDDSIVDINGDGTTSSEDLICIRTVLLYKEENLKSHIVTFKTSDGTLLNIQSVKHSFAAIAPTAPIIDNYKFIGWSENIANIMNDIEVFPQYILDNKPTFSIDNVTSFAGESICIAVEVKNNPGILGMTLSIEFDEKVMTLTDAKNGSALNGVLNFTKANILKSGCNFVWDGQDISSENILDGKILLLYFDISDNIQSGSYPITISYETGNIIDGNLNSVDFEIENANITIL